MTHEYYFNPTSMAFSNTEVSPPPEGVIFVTIEEFDKLTQLRYAGHELYIEKGIIKVTPTIAPSSLHKWKNGAWVVDESEWFDFKRQYTIERLKTSMDDYIQSNSPMMISDDGDDEAMQLIIDEIRQWNRDNTASLALTETYCASMRYDVEEFKQATLYALQERNRVLVRATGLRRQYQLQIDSIEDVAEFDNLIFDFTELGE